MRFFELIPNADDLLRLEPQELAGVLLTYLNTLNERDQDWNHHNFFNNPTDRFYEYPTEKREGIAQAFGEAWAWLATEGLIVPNVRLGQEWYTASRRGAKLKTREDVAVYRKASILPHAQLHPAIAHTVFSTFLRGDYDTAVFQAFREVEVAVRTGGSFPPDLVGVPLMRKAFDKQSGPLTDTGQVEAEREALAHLFAGAIGYCKNPPSHRSVSLDAVTAAEMIAMASHLLRVVDARAAARVAARDTT